MSLQCQVLSNSLTRILGQKFYSGSPKGHYPTIKEIVIKAEGRYLTMWPHWKDRQRDERALVWGGGHKRCVSLSSAV